MAAVLREDVMVSNLRKNGRDTKVIISFLFRGVNFFQGSQDSMSLKVSSRYVRPSVIKGLLRILSAIETNLDTTVWPSG